MSISYYKGEGEGKKREDIVGKEKEKAAAAGRVSCHLKAGGLSLFSFLIHLVPWLEDLGISLHKKSLPLELRNNLRACKGKGAYMSEKHYKTNARVLLQ